MRHGDRERGGRKQRPRLAGHLQHVLRRKGKSLRLSANKNRSAKDGDLKKKTVTLRRVRCVLSSSRWNREKEPCPFAADSMCSWIAELVNEKSCYSSMRFTLPIKMATTCCRVVRVRCHRGGQRVDHVLAKNLLGLPHAVGWDVQTISKTFRTASNSICK